MSPAPITSWSDDFTTDHIANGDYTSVAVPAANTAYMQGYTIGPSGLSVADNQYVSILDKRAPIAPGWTKVTTILEGVWHQIAVTSEILEAGVGMSLAGPNQSVWPQRILLSGGGSEYQPTGFDLSLIGESGTAPGVGIQEGVPGVPLAGDGVRYGVAWEDGVPFQIKAEMWPDGSRTFHATAPAGLLPSGAARQFLIATSDQAYMAQFNQSWQPFGPFDPANGSWAFWWDEPGVSQGGSTNPPDGNYYRYLTADLTAEMAALAAAGPMYPGFYLEAQVGMTLTRFAYTVDPQPLPPPPPPIPKVAIGRQYVGLHHLL